MKQLKETRRDNKLKIAQIAPLFESVPPKLYGGTERVVSYLTEELVRLGHNVTLFASGDSKTSAELVHCCDRSLRLDPEIKESLPYHIIEMEKVRRRAEEFDFLHFHIDYLHAPLVREFNVPTLGTHHGRLDLPELKTFYSFFPTLPLVSISNSQRKDLPIANWIDTVYHGVPSELFSFHSIPHGDYLAFLGRISPDKRVDRAIEIAVRTGMKLKIAAKIDRVDLVYWKEEIKPLIQKHSANVEYIGEISDNEKAEFLGNAIALLFPIDWSEPFGLVMIEAMACGTPVIGFRRGSVPEILKDGISGFIVDTVNEAVAAVANISDLDRAKVRSQYDDRFTAEHMAKNYIKLYEQQQSR